MTQAGQDRSEAAEQPQPVFVDGTGRRRRLAVVFGATIAVGLLVSLTLIIVGLFTGTPAPLPGWPDSRPPQHDGAVVDRLGNSPTPTPTASPSAPVNGPGPSSPPPATASGGPANSPAPRAGVTDRPGQGTGHRPTAKPTKSPGRPQ